MSLPEPKGSPFGEWLRRARSNLAQARCGLLSPDMIYEDLCFAAQQAAEKAIKAVLIQRGASFPKSHDIAALLTLAERSGIKIPDNVLEANLLTEYAVEARYPGLVEEVSAEEYRQALSCAEAVVSWAEALLHEPI